MIRPCDRTGADNDSTGVRRECRQRACLRISRISTSLSGMPRDLKVGVLRVFAENIRNFGERIAAFAEPDGGYPRALGRIPSPLYRSSGEKTKDEQAFAYLADVRAPRRHSRTFRRQKRCQGVRHGEKGARSEKIETKRISEA